MATALRLAYQAWSLSRRGSHGHKIGYKFSGLNFECLNPEHFGLLYTEIFIGAPYAFRPTRADPFIIDGGVNIGLSVAFFKTAYPKSRIIGFEPHPKAYEVAKRNFEQNRFTDVQLLNAAITGAGKQVELQFIPEEIMASTIGNRLAVRGAKPQSVMVPAVQLSEFLTAEVDFLKLDIEGAETAVLEEAGAKLRLIRNMFVEFHVTRGDETNDLSRLIKLLQDQRFDYLITSTLGNRRNAAVAPIYSCGPVSSISIHAARIE